MISRKRWDAGANPLEMLNSVRQMFARRNLPQQCDRKLQLYLLALCRRDWEGSLWLCKKIIELSEAAIEGTFDPAALRQPLDYIAEGIWLSTEYGIHLLADYERYVVDLGFEKPPDADSQVDFSNLPRLALQAAMVGYAAPGSDWRVDHGLSRSLHSVELIRDIFGNPFRPVSFSASWRTTTAVSIAKGMYDAREFSAMPLLADALEDAGCAHADILEHCRGAGPHVRGCWVVDLVLDKS